MASLQSAGIVSGGQLDNFTRVSHAHGSDFAAEFWRFGDLAFDDLQAFCKKNAVAFKQQTRLRLIVNEHELKEAKLAAKQLKAAGIAVDFYDDLAATPFGKEVTARVLAIQQEARGAFCEPAEILKKLRYLTNSCEAFSAVERIAPTPDHVTIYLKDGSSINAEMVVMAAHLDTAAFIPDLAAAFVAVADQWSEFEITNDSYKTSPWADVGIVFSAHHGYELGVVSGPNRLRFGGGRYLRPLAGVGAKAAQPEERIEKHLQEQLAKTFSWARSLTPIGRVAGLENRPCDELPIIGPMFGESRLLIATGFMGSGTTQGFFAGKCLAELIKSGESPALPRRLWPERLRTLAVTDG